LVIGFYFYFIFILKGGKERQDKTFEKREGTSDEHFIRRFFQTSILLHKRFDKHNQTATSRKIKVNCNAKDN